MFFTFYETNGVLAINAVADNEVKAQSFTNAKSLT